jgi:hypothetical protein
MPGVAPSRPHSDGAIIEAEMGPYLLAASTSFGPRLVSLRFRQGPELFAQLGDDIAIEHPDSGTYRFHGGHRLWAAPEVPSISYASDDHDCVVTTGPDRLTISAPVDSAGIIKRVSVGLEEATLAVDHFMENAGDHPIAVAPWGITQFRMGGVALIPAGTPGASGAVQGDSSLVIWPYTDLADPRLSWRRRAALIRGAPGPRFKIGSSPTPGRIGYWIEQQLFTKAMAPAEAGRYADRGAVAQVFVDESFCELESLGPIVALEPGALATHREVWEVTDCGDLATAYRRVTGEVGG